jgi:hypothetical protein
MPAIPAANTKLITIVIAERIVHGLSAPRPDIERPTSADAPPGAAACR